MALWRCPLKQLEMFLSVIQKSMFNRLSKFKMSKAIQNCIVGSKGMAILFDGRICIGKGWHASCLIKKLYFGVVKNEHKGSQETLGKAKYHDLKQSFMNKLKKKLTLKIDCSIL